MDFSFSVVQHTSPLCHSFHALLCSQKCDLGLSFILIFLGLGDFRICLCSVKQIWMKLLHTIQMLRRYWRKRQSKCYVSTLIHHFYLILEDFTSLVAVVLSAVSLRLVPL